MAHRYKRSRHPETGAVVYDHRLIMEQKLGRPLAPGEVVDHVDEDRANLSPTNLQAFRSQRQHMLYHQRKKKEARGQPHLFPLDEYLEVMG